MLCAVTPPALLIIQVSISGRISIYRNQNAGFCQVCKIAGFFQSVQETHLSGENRQNLCKHGGAKDGCCCWNDLQPFLPAAPLILLVGSWQRSLQMVITGHYNCYK